MKTLQQNLFVIKHLFETITVHHHPHHPNVVLRKVEKSLWNDKIYVATEFLFHCSSSYQNFNVKFDPLVFNFRRETCTDNGLNVYHMNYFARCYGLYKFYTENKWIYSSVYFEINILSMTSSFWIQHFVILSFALSGSFFCRSFLFYS